MYDFAFILKIRVLAKIRFFCLLNNVFFHFVLHSIQKNMKKVEILTFLGKYFEKYQLILKSKKRVLDKHV